jgi:hypothetical protein
MFRLVRQGGSSSFVRRQESKPFVGTIKEALEFADRIQQHFSDAAHRVEAWSIGEIAHRETGERELFFIQRHENKRDWRLLESGLTHPGWFLKLTHAVDYVAFRARGCEAEIRVRDGEIERVIVACKVDAVILRPPVLS